MEEIYNIQLKEQYSSTMMKSAKIVLIAVFAIVATAQNYFSGYNLDQNLLSSTDRAMSNLEGLLTVFSCRGNSLFQDTGSSYGFNPRRYVFYSSVNEASKCLQNILNRLQANSIIKGSNNIVTGGNNIMIGNNGIVSGQNIWVFSNSLVVNGNSLLVIGNFEINMAKIGDILSNPSSAIRCLDPNQLNSYYQAFKNQAGFVMDRLKTMI